MIFSIDAQWNININRTYISNWLENHNYRLEKSPHLNGISISGNNSDSLTNLSNWLTTYLTHETQSNKTF